MTALHRVQYHNVASNGTWIVRVGMLVRSDIVISLFLPHEVMRDGTSLKLSIFTARKFNLRTRDNRPAIAECKTGSVRNVSYGIHSWPSSLLGKKHFPPVGPLGR